MITFNFFFFTAPPPSRTSVPGSAAASAPPEMEARLARQEKELSKPKIRRVKALASKSKGQKSASRTPVQAGSVREVVVAARPPITQTSGPADVQGSEVRAVTPVPVSDRKRAAPEPQESSAAKKGKAAACTETITWQPAWSLKVDDTVSGDEKKSLDFLTNVVLPIDADEVVAKTDAALIKSVAADYYRVCS
jgi:hypothetical protein